MPQKTPDVIEKTKTGFQLIQNPVRIGNYMFGQPNGGSSATPIEHIIQPVRYGSPVTVHRRPPEEVVTVFSFISSDTPGVPDSWDILLGELVRKQSKGEDKIALTYKLDKVQDKREIMLRGWDKLGTSLKYPWYKEPYGHPYPPYISSYCGREWIDSGWGDFTGETELENNAVFFKDYVWFTWDGSVLFSKLSSLNGKKPVFTKEIKIAISGSEEDRYIYKICFIYQEGTQYKLVVFKENGPWSVYSRIRDHQAFSAWLPYKCFGTGPQEPPIYPDPPTPPPILWDSGHILGYLGYEDISSWVVDGELLPPVEVCPAHPDWNPPVPAYFASRFNASWSIRNPCGGGDLPLFSTITPNLLFTEPSSDGWWSGWWVAPGVYGGGTILSHKYGPDYKISFARYTSNSLEGPWTLEKEWPDIRKPYADYYQQLNEDETIKAFNGYHIDLTTPTATNIINELSDLILSKNNKELSIAVGYNDPFLRIIAKAYFPDEYSDPENPLWGAYVLSRGREGEIVMRPEDKIFLVKRKGGVELDKKTIVLAEDETKSEVAIK